MGDDYAKRQAMKDADYTREYKAWIRSLAPEEQWRLVELGLAAPMVSRDGGGFLDKDAADSPMASETPAVIFDDELQPKPPPAFGSEQIWDAIRRLLGELLVQKNAKLALECMALASGVSFLGDSMTEIARRHGLTRASVSKRCVELARKIGLPPSRAMRSLTARAAYAQARKQSLRRRGH
jgi:hypothetical protein